jgi:TfuA protein
VTASPVPRTIVFAGPSLPPAARPDLPAFEWRPPAAAGDILALVDDPPDRLCLIDGFFDWCAAPWHKEILFVMARGTAVFGAASMGALRAAELDRLGMIGVGAIYKAYRDGRLTGDDEVALVHAPERLDWAPLTVPMVEFRATLIAGCSYGLFGVTTARRIRSAVHDLHFSCRDWPLIRKCCLSEGLAEREALDRLEALHVPLKRRDALACLEAARCGGAAGAVQAPPRTAFIEALQAELAGLPAQAPAPSRSAEAWLPSAAADGGI